MNTRISTPGFFALFSAILLAAACGETDQGVTAPVAEAPGGPSLAKPASDSVLIAVTVATGGGNRIQGDGLGEYVHGFQGMQAVIDRAGGLQIAPNNANSPTPPQRTLGFDYSAPIDPLNLYRPDASPQWNFKIMVNRVDTGNPRIQDLAVNASGCYNASFYHWTPTMVFQDDFNLAIASQATSVHITRTSPTTWTMVSNGPCLLNANVASLRSRDRLAKNAPQVFRGYYNQQFSISFRALP
jgi:hypothetical protein